MIDTKSKNSLKLCGCQQSLTCGKDYYNNNWRSSKTDGKDIDNY